MSKVSNSYGTTIDEINDGIYRISSPLTDVPGGFSFNQYLIDDEEPMLFHTGPRTMFGLVKEAIEKVMPIGNLKYIGFSHYEQDECGSLNDFLAHAKNAAPVCSRVNAMINGDGMDRVPRALADGEVLSLGKRQMKWFDTPHLPHGWECGYLFDQTSGTFFCGDLFTQGGAKNPALTEGDILGPSENFRKQMDYFSHSINAKAMLEKLAMNNPKTLACMHGSAWRGDGKKILLELAASMLP
jgi:flavorubredoxin